MLHTKLIHTEAELAQFAKIYYQKSDGIPTDMSFLQTSIVRVFIEDQRPDEWVAGYSINANAPYRYLSAHSEEQQKAMLEQAGIPANDIIEIGTIWMNLAALGRKAVGRSIR